VSPTRQPFEGLTGAESNPDSSGKPVTVFKIDPTTANAYFMPGADPGEGYMATNSQPYGSTATPPSGQIPANQGFVAGLRIHAQLGGIVAGVVDRPRYHRQ
jgi:phospholipase C